MDKGNVLDGRDKWPERFGRIARMGDGATIKSEDALRELRLRYYAAYLAYQSAAMAISEASASGLSVPKELLASEAQALNALTIARAKLLEAMARAV